MSLKFSVLLPTKNRLDLLRMAVDTVLRQSYADWEIVIADNASEDDIAGYAAALGEPRVKYVRSDRPLPVTDNWNRALENSSGDYVIMLGDDDGLLKGHLAEAARLIEAHRRPDLVLTDALLFTYPTVFAGRGSGYLQIGYGVFFEGRREPYLVERGMAKRAAQDALKLRQSYQYNMQYSIVSRRLIERVRRYGPYFQSPYPDFYASNMNLLVAERILAVPRPMVCIGISPRSFGFYYYNRRQEEGTRFLDNLLDQPTLQRLAPFLMPGDTLLTCWLAAVDTVRENLREAPVDGTPLRVGYRHYRFLQLWNAASVLPRREVLQVYAAARWWELLLFGPVALVLLVVRRYPGVAPCRWAKRTIDRLMSPHPSRDTRVRDIGARNMAEVYDAVAPEYY